MTRAANPLLAAVRSAHRQQQADQAMSVQGWCAQHLLLPRTGGATEYDPDQTPYWGQWMDIAQARIGGQPLDYDDSAHLVEQLWLCCANQLGKTLGFLLPLAVWIAATHPRATGICYPRGDDIRKARTRARPLLEKSPGLGHLLPGGQAELERRLGTKIWALSTCDWHWLVGNAAMDLRTMDLPLVLLDEFDRLLENVEDEGDPVELLLDRQKTYPLDRMCVGITTPTIAQSHGWYRLAQGGHHRLHIACPSCGSHHYLAPTHLRAVDGCTDTDEIKRYDLALWHCPTCSAGHTTAQVRAALALASAVRGWSAEHGGWMPGLWTASANNEYGGTWEPRATRNQDGRLECTRWERGSVRSAQLGSLYSPWITLGEYLAHDLGSRQRAADRHAHINGWDGEPYAGAADGLTEATVEALTAPSPSAYTLGSIAENPWRLVLTADQQGITAESSTFPYVLRAWHTDGSSHLVDTGTAEGFSGLELLEQKTWPCGDTHRRLDVLTVDSANGHMLRHIRRWCAQAPTRRASLAGSGSLSPEHAWSEIKRNNRNAAKLQGLPVVWYFNAHLYRDTLREQMDLKTWHIPTDAPAWYLASLTSEERVSEPTTIKGRRAIRTFWRPKEWKDERGNLHVRRDNHWWDCEVMQQAIVEILGWYKRQPPKPPARPRGQLSPQEE